VLAIALLQPVLDLIWQPVAVSNEPPLDQILTNFFKKLSTRCTLEAVVTSTADLIGAVLVQKSHPVVTVTILTTLPL